MATPETKLAAARGGSDVSNSHGTPPSNRHLQNFNTFQFVSQLVSATPPYLFNMSTPFPGNFFSDLLRRMAPRAGTPGLPLDTTLQQHIRAALLAKGTPPPAMPPTVMPPPLDLAALAAQHRQHQHQQQQHQNLVSQAVSTQDKGVKRSLFSDVNALSGEDDSNSKRARLEESSREERREHPSEGLTAPFLMQPPFLPSSIPPPPDVLPAWPGRASLMRPQMPIPAHVPPAPLDPYRLLLDLRLAGQLRSMAATQALHHKDPPLGTPVPLPLTRGRSPPPPSIRETRPKEDMPSIPSQTGPLKSEESRVSAFHPPGKTESHVETSDEEERRSTSSNSNCSSNSLNREGLGPQYIFKHLTEIYRTIDHQRSENEESGGEGTNKSEHHQEESHSLDQCRPPTETILNNAEMNEVLDRTKSLNGNGEVSSDYSEKEAACLRQYYPQSDQKTLKRNGNDVVQNPTSKD